MIVNPDHNSPLAEFSRLTDVTSCASKPRRFDFNATDGERQALAVRYGVLKVDILNSRGKISVAGKGRYRLRATFCATVIQACGLSLEPVTEEISGEFSVLLYQPFRKEPPQSAGINFDPDEEDMEFLKGDKIDIGELIAQNLSLEINPYPRKADATGEELGQKILTEGDILCDLKKQNPFDILKTLKE